MRTDIREGVVEVLNRSGVSETDCRFWFGILEGQTEGVQAMFLDIFHGYEDLLPAITEDMRLKVAALNDPSKVRDVLDHEIRIFESEKVFE